MNNVTQSLIAIVTAIISVAILAVLVSSRAKTSEVITSAGAALANDISAAVAPVTGASAQINTGGGGFGLGGFSGLGAPLNLGNF